MTTVVVLQSNYLPWKGYFDLIHDADIFVFYDDVQYTKNDWRNRNKIKALDSTQWLTIPVGTSSHRLVCEVEILDHSWQRRHWALIEQHYATAPFFSRYAPFVEDFLLQREWSRLSELNHYLIKTIATDFLGIDTKFADSRDFPLAGRKQERLLELLGKVGATRYVSGPAARSYIDPGEFEDRNIELVWKDYGGYPEYPQLHGQFEHGVTILDLLFCVGPDSPWHIWGWRAANGLAR